MTYKDAHAFRRALTDRLNREARERGVDVARLQKRLAFERFLARLFRSDSERWVLKGGYALELRLRDQARTTQDLDLSVPPPPLVGLLDKLQEAAACDLGDFFEFRVARSRGDLKGPPLGGERFHVEVLLDGRVFSRFPVDVGQGDTLSTAPERVAGLVDLGFAGLPTPALAVYPLAEHFAEKIHAYTRPRENPSRVKDLVDMLLILELGLAVTQELREVIEATFARYATHPLPKTLPPPPASWKGPFAAMAREVNLGVRDMTTAHHHLRRTLAAIGL